MELQLIKAGLSSRGDFLTILKYVSPEKYQKELKYVFKFIHEYYQRDTSCNHVDLSLLKAQIAEVTDNDKHIARFHELLDTANAVETSSSNVAALVVLARQHEVKVTLATALANDESPEKIDVILQEYNQLRAASSLGDLEEGESAEVIENINVLELTDARLERGALLELYPQSLNRRIDGGLEGGDHVVLFGPTEIGKSAFSINAAAGFAYQGFPGLYLINEDKTSRIAERIVSCLSGMDKFAVRNDPTKAQRIADSRGMGNIRVIGLTPGSIRGVEALVEKYKPRWVVSDQMRNFMTGTRNNRVVQLEETATGLRNVGKAANCVMVSVTQAGDSATNKIFLDVGDVDFSNVGIPSQADLMVGVGADAQLLASGNRGLSLPKNKLSGDHAQFFVRLLPTLSQVRDLS